MRGQRMMSTSHEPLATTFIIPTGLPGPSGGSRYNKALIRALEAAGCSVSVCGVPGPWPRPEARDLERLRAALAGREQVVVDGLIASSAPDEIQAAAQAQVDATGAPRPVKVTATAVVIAALRVAVERMSA